jgi:hypothetical protein
MEISSRSGPTLGAVLLIGAMLSSCAARRSVDRESSGPPEPPTVDVVITAAFEALNVPSCADDQSTEWSAIPLAVGSGKGVARSIKETTAPVGTGLPSNGKCKLVHTFSNLAPGRWRITVDAGVASGVCEADLRAGRVVASLTDDACTVLPERRLEEEDDKI